MGEPRLYNMLPEQAPRGLGGTVDWPPMSYTHSQVLALVEAAEHAANVMDRLFSRSDNAEFAARNLREKCQPFNQGGE